MKTFLSPFSSGQRNTLLAMLLGLAAPVLLSAQQPVDPPMVDHPMMDSLHHRMERRMAEMQNRLDAIQEYLSQTDHELLWASPPDFPDFPFDQEGRADSENEIPEMKDAEDFPFYGLPPHGPGFQFFEEFEDPEEWDRFLRQNLGNLDKWISIEELDTVAGTNGKRVTTIVLRGRTNDTVVFEGDGSLGYSFADSNGHFVVRGHNLVGDTIFLRNGKSININGISIYGDTAISDTTGNFVWTWDNRRPGRHSYRYFDRQKKHYPSGDSRRGYAWSYPDQSQSARLSDLTPDDISRLKNTDLNPTRRIIPLGIDDLKVTPFRSTRQLRVEFSSPGNDNLTVQLFDTDGNLIHDEHLNRHSGEYDNRIKIADLAGQSLYIRISRGKQSLMKRIDL